MPRMSMTALRPFSSSGGATLPFLPLNSLNTKLGSSKWIERAARQQHHTLSRFDACYDLAFSFVAQPQLDGDFFKNSGAALNGHICLLGGAVNPQEAVGQDQRIRHF